MAKLQHIHLEKLSSDEVFSSKLVFSLYVLYVETHCCVMMCVECFVL